MIRRVAFLLWLVLAASPALAVEPDEMLPDPTLEARARAISAELRCLVCQNQSIDDSHAALARDLRLLVRERLKAGDSDAAVENYLVDRYGAFVLLRPPLTTQTALLWGLPFLLLIGAGMVLLRQRHRSRAVAVAPLTAAEEAELARIVNHGGNSTE